MNTIPALTPATQAVPAPVPVLPDTAPFTPEQRAWLNGFFAGLFSRGPGAVAGPGAQGAGGGGAAPLPLTILYGSQTGGAEILAKRAGKEAARAGYAPAVADMAGMTAERLAGAGRVLVITSTYGDGEPPDSARALHGELKAGTGPSLAGLCFSVCAIGDSNYPLFCQCGKDFDTFLEGRGAARVAPRAECDVGQEAVFEGWLRAALAACAAGGAGTAPAGTGTGGGPGGGVEGAANAGGGSGRTGAGSAEGAGASAGFVVGYSRANPFSAPVLAVRRLNGEGSAKEVNHVEFSLEGSGLSYEAGDALGVWPRNCPELVGEVLSLLGCDGEEAVPGPAGAPVSLRRALEESYCLGRPKDELIALFGAGPGPGTAGGGAAGALAYLDVLDVLEASGGRRPSAAAFVGALRKLQPRLYSISSSPKAHPGQVHLTVGAVRYEKGGRMRKGVCSTFLAERVGGAERVSAAAGSAAEAGRAGVFIHANRAFRPPSDPRAAAIMIGPGTGIAPFRAFLEERRAVGGGGRNWLFFGDQRAGADFLYREELEGFARDGTLTRLDTAFSRDQEAKVYVQHRMLEAAGELFAWLEGGAHVYVCGDASRMAKDVDAALHRVVETAGSRSAEQASAYVQALRAGGRYARDVY